MNREIWLAATADTLVGYRRMIDAAVSQLTDEQFFQRPAPHLNSVAVLLRHLGGNLQSRWLNFLTEDGEKPDRDRDREFEDWSGNRHSLMQYFEQGWDMLTSEIESLTDQQLSQMVTIRGEAHTVPRAIQRSLAHVSYHVGQLMIIARLVRGGDDDWKWITIPPGGSARHNRETWGTAASRGVAGGRL